MAEKQWKQQKSLYRTETEKLSETTNIQAWQYKPAQNTTQKNTTERTAQAVGKMHDVKSIKSLGQETSMALFKTVKMPILKYGIEIIGEQLTMVDLEIL